MQVVQTPGTLPSSLPLEKMLQLGSRGHSLESQHLGGQIENSESKTSLTTQ